MKSAVDEIDTLLGSASRPARWGDLRRHVHFGMVQDLLDIQKLDWSAVRDSIRSKLYGEEDPLPVAIHVLGEVVAANSRRMDPIGLSAYGFCQGLDGLVMTSVMAMPATRRRNKSR